MVIKQVTHFGRNWARLGLDKGRMALENSADRLRATAELLGNWSNKLSPSPGESADSASEGAEVSTAGETGDRTSAETPQNAAN